MELTTNATSGTMSVASSLTVSGGVWLSGNSSVSVGVSLTLSGGAGGVDTEAERLSERDRQRWRGVGGGVKRFGCGERRNTVLDERRHVVGGHDRGERQPVGERAANVTLGSVALLGAVAWTHYGSLMLSGERHVGEHCGVEHAQLVVSVTASLMVSCGSVQNGTVTVASRCSTWPARTT